MISGMSLMPSVLRVETNPSDIEGDDILLPVWKMVAVHSRGNINRVCVNRKLA